MTRRLPVHVQPLAGESLRSVLEESARRHGARLADLYAAAGVNRAETWTASAAHLDHALHDPDVDALTLSLGLDPRALRSLTLEPRLGTVVEGWRGRKAQHTGHKAPPRAGYCPRCLAETGGRWKLDWLSPWTTYCTRHQQHLLRACPACRQEPRPTTRLVAHHPAPPAALCTAPLRPATPGGHRHTGARVDDYFCLTDLRTASTTSAHPTSASAAGQTHLDEIVAAGPHERVATAMTPEPLPADEYLADLRYTARKMHAWLVPGDYPLAPAEDDALHRWHAYRLDHPRSVRELASHPDWNTDIAQAHQVSYSACVGLAAQALAAPSHDEAAAAITPLLNAQIEGKRFPSGVRSRWHDASMRLRDFLARIAP
jgi:hypothetical protein